MKQTAAKKDEIPLNEQELRFLERARKMFRANTDWFQFESFAFGLRSPIFSKTRTHKDVVTNPVYLELEKMWLQLGLQQGRIAPNHDEKKDASRRQTRRRR